MSTAATSHDDRDPRERTTMSADRVTVVAGHEVGAEGGTPVVWGDHL